MTRAFVAVGSNINPEENVRAALRALAERTRIVSISTVYQTEPEGSVNQPCFYNCVVEIETDTAPEKLKFEVLREIEASLGRRRTSDKYAPRTIDLDLILYGDLVQDADGVVLPDPDVTRRPFLAVPLAELAPELTLPGTGVPIVGLAARLRMDRAHPLLDYTARLRKEIISCPSAAAFAQPVP